MPWTYNHKCNDCHVTYSNTFDDLLIGPFGLQQIIGEPTHTFGIIGYETKPLYDGAGTKIVCPICRFSCSICSDLTGPSMLPFIRLAQLDWPQYEVTTYFDQRGRFIGFPLPCLCCETQILESNERRRCRECGSPKLSLICQAQN